LQERFSATTFFYRFGAGFTEGGAFFSAATGFAYFSNRANFFRLFGCLQLYQLLPV